MANATLREISIPRFALRGDEAAASVGVSLSTFKKWVEVGKMPKGIPVDGVVLYDTERVRSAWIALRDVVDAPEDTSDDWGDDPA